jgi:signal peptidase I
VFKEITAELLRRGSYIRFRAIGASMQPTIEDGELITVAPVAPESVKRGDILLYQNERGVFAHRVVGLQAHRPAEDKDKDPSTYLLPSGEKAGMRGRVVPLLRGDASESYDPPVALQQILGRVVAVQRGNRSLALDSRLGNLMRLARLRIAKSKAFRLLHLNYRKCIKNS